MKTRFFTSLALILFMFMLTIPLSAQADQLYEYSYTSGLFTYDGGPDFPLPASSYSIAISFTYGAITAADAGVNMASLVSNFTISDGPLTFTNPSETKLEFGLTAPSVPGTPPEIPPGGWYVLSYGSSHYLSGQNAFTMLVDSYFGINPDWPLNYAGDTSEEAAYYGPTDYGYNETVGVWTVTPVPEPCTMLLLGSGLVGLATIRKRF